MRSARAACRHAVAAVVAAAVVSGCGLTHLQDLSFRVDNRLHFVSPRARATVAVPLTVSWAIRDFRVAAPGSEPPTKDAGYFAVFVDRSPVRPGRTTRDVASGDLVCERNPQCPDDAYLRQHLVFTTTRTSITVPQIPNITGNQERLQLHTITVVLMDTSGHRIGESAWQLDVRIPRVGLS